MKGVRHQFPVKGRSTVPEAYSLTFTPLLFGRLANEKKEVLVDVIGLESSEMSMMKEKSCTRKKKAGSYEGWN